MSSSSWSRPASVPFPSVWRRFPGLRPLADGSMPHFRIQDVTEDLQDAVVDHMATYLVRDEPMCFNRGFLRDPQSMQEIRTLWNEMLRYQVSLVALLEREEGKPPLVAGCNLLGVDFIQDKEKVHEFQGGPMHVIVKALEDIEAKVDVFEHYGVKEYMNAMGLSVAPEYRGMGLGIELLRARFDLCRAVKLPLTVTVFSSMPSQILAHRVGMEVLAEIPYDEYKVDDKIVFPGMTIKSFKLMAKRIEQETKDSDSEGELIIRA